ncbi:MAG: YqgE/AlgH family protein [Paracoccus sp. (in: a-proteobacteria)]|uniref:YqgE/AlgH family protein n=1 Tax=Paracoccus sp. TaxID=267 RepID=UPI0026DFF54C|nr:YqgE/AlgH family protein [Paracoccus sp. (in: a-proteobacteria)]MDO5621459.1 YqgE/AlgH family protein [Paracoccus sp. (in: a-proteobacteria)]
MSASQDLTGQILIAMPGMNDPRFAQSLVLICAHGADGAMGLIVNRPLPRPGFVELLDQLQIDHGAEVAPVPVHFGGPVETGRGFVLHHISGSDAPEIVPGVAMSATLDVLRELARDPDPAPALLALGYAGWGPGQLEAEFLANGWMAAPYDETLVFGGDHAAKWAQALRFLGIDPALLSPAAGRA